MVFAKVERQNKVNETKVSYFIGEDLEAVQEIVEKAWPKPHTVLEVTREEVESAVSGFDLMVGLDSVESGRHATYCLLNQAR